MIPKQAWLVWFLAIISFFLSSCCHGECVAGECNVYPEPEDLDHSLSSLDDTARSFREQEWYENDAIRNGYGDGWFTTLYKGKSSVHIAENIVCISDSVGLDGEKITSISYGDLYFLADTPDSDTIWNLFMVSSGKYDESKLNIPTEEELAEMRETERKKRLLYEVDRIAKKVYEEEISHLSPVTNTDYDYLLDELAEKIKRLREYNSSNLGGRYTGFSAQ